MKQQEGEDDIDVRSWLWGWVSEKRNFSLAE